MNAADIGSVVRWCVAVIICAGSAWTQAGVVTVANVSAVQRAAEPVVDIHYDLLNPHGGTYVVAVEVSNTLGAAYTLAATNFSGDIGAGISTGVHKWIVWNAAADMPPVAGMSTRVRVTATDGRADTNGMVYVPGGAFAMGNCLNPDEGYSDEVPVHTVYVDAFFMDAAPIISAKWWAVYTWATNHGYAFENAGASKATNHPVQTVAWYDCVKWCNARSQQEGLGPCYYTDGMHTSVYRRGMLDLTDTCVVWQTNGYRLPTEAEWERAARGGRVGWRFPWADPTITHTNANYVSMASYSYDTSATRGFHPAFDDGSMLYTSPVGYFAPNALGLYDMAGNVFVWCWDWYDSDYYMSSPATNPRGPVSGYERELRGGAWLATGQRCRTAYRWQDDPDAAETFYGVRCVRRSAGPLPQ
jgi:formylglycine-generating enzyme required for sulfatase activity